jgi:small GTP-binding protein
MIDLKCSIIGSSGVGKTFIFNTLFNKSINDISGTIGPTVQTKILKAGMKSIRIRFVDTSGSERFRSVSRGYFKHSDIILLIFDLTSKKSFEELEEWMDDILTLCDPETHVLVIGNQKRISDEQQISKTELKQFSKKFHVQYQEIDTSKETEIKSTIQGFFDQVIHTNFPKIFLKDRNNSISNIF